jgi:predicted DNA-binding protein (UPF0251 family)
MKQPFGGSSEQERAMSPRPKKKRLCCGQFCGRAYKPSGTPLQELRHIAIQEDELEVLRLCDFEGLFQVQAGERMGVSRGTVQRMLTSARRKVAEALSTGAALVFAMEDPPEE